MYRVLVVDDEPYVANDLCEYLSDLEELELEVYTAYSAEDALLLLKKARVDIIVSDICMPRINGMDLLNHVQQSWPRCKVIFLTGHADYQYVRDAMTNRAFGYILKTEDRNEILLTIRKAIDSLQSEMHDEQLIRLANENIRKAMPILQQEFVSELLETSDAIYEQFPSRFKELEISLCPDKDILLLVGKVDDWYENTPASKKMMAFYTLQSVVQEHLSPFCTVFSTIYERNMPVWLLQSHEETMTWDKLALFIKESLESVQATYKKLMQLTVSFSLNETPIAWPRLSERFTALSFLLERESGDSAEAILLDSCLSAQDMDFILGPDRNRKVDYYNKSFKLLEAFLKNGQKQEFMKLFDSMLRFLRGQNPSYNQCLEIYHSFALLFLSHINRWGMPHYTAESLPWETVRPKDMEAMLETTFSQCRQLAEEIFGERFKDQEDRSRSVADFLQKYIHDHLNDNLSLINLSDMVCLHPKYLSRVFKQETGTTVLEYVNEARLSMAKKLLKTTDMKVHEVATAVGLDSVQYFIRFFRKKIGMPPQKYREMDLSSST